jgi:drug/metabolite transporter (DMT)-like permease
MSALVKTIAYTLAWMSASSSLIMLNKHILSDLGVRSGSANPFASSSLLGAGGLALSNRYTAHAASPQFHYPLTLCSLGAGFSSFCAIMAVHVLQVSSLTTPITRDFYFRRVFPIGAFAAATLSLGNIAYLYLSVSFIQILKAATPVMTSVVCVAAGLDKPSTAVLVAVSVIALGTAVSSYGELAFSLTGFLFVLGGEFAEACRLAATQFLLSGLSMTLMEGVYYLAPATFSWLLFSIIPLEFQRMRDENALAIVTANPASFFFAGTLGFGVTLLSYGVISLTSSTTYKVLGQLKNVAVILASVVMFGNKVSNSQAAGYVVACVGFYMYNKAKQEQAEAERTAQTLAKEAALTDRRS